MAAATEPEVKTRRWRRVEYERLVDLGIFAGERLELLDGLLVVKEPQNSVVEILRPPATVTPLAAPGVVIHVADLLP